MACHHSQRDMNRSRELAVIGAGGFSGEVADVALLTGWDSIRLYDDNPATVGKVVAGNPCVGSVADFEHDAPSDYIIGIGRNLTRRLIGQRLEAAGHRAVSIIHPYTAISRSAEIGCGAFIGIGVFVGPQVKIGRHALLNVGSSVGHDASLGDWVQLCPGARVSGFCRLENGAFMGSNSVLAPQVAMGEWSQLAATSFAMKSIPANCLAGGSPARIAPP
jgi:sugar O-acyltransferase (sialic acid O-acetyltransferase NeuD family)